MEDRHHNSQLWATLHCKSIHRLSIEHLQVTVSSFKYICMACPVKSTVKAVGGDGFCWTGVHEKFQIECKSSKVALLKA